MGILLNGKYYKDGEVPPEARRANIGAQIYSYNLESQAKQHDMDLIQPYLADGSPNPEFKKYYPELTKQYGMEEE